MLRDIGNIVTWISIILLTTGYVWSFIIAWRASKGLFILVLLFWIVGYPILLVKYWKQTKNNFYVVLVGIASFALAFAILAATNPNRISTSYFDQHYYSAQQVIKQGRTD